MINTIILGHASNVLPKLPAESVSCVTTSPPYWSLRDYGIEPVIWDGDKEFYSESLKKYIPMNCKHDFSIETKAGDIRFRGKNSIVGSERNPKVWEGDGRGQFCRRCGAWRGSLGLEPTFELYIKHLCDIFDQVKRVLRKDGTCFVNIGDTYASSPAGNKEIKYSGDGVYGRLMKRHTQGGTSEVTYKPKKYSVPVKSLCDIPYRFSIEMTNRGWIKRNTIIWHKLNCMPSSADDRFTIDFEYLFFFTKNNKVIFWTNEKTLECVSKKPLGIKGTEGEDWEWRKCPVCQGTGGETKMKKKDAEQMGSPRARYHRITKQEECKRCKGSGKIKVSFWTGHDYWFEQQFEEWTDKNIHDTKRAGKYIQYGGKHKNSDDNKGVVVGNPKQGRNKRCVWIIPTQPFPEAHFAVYPEGLIEIPIKAGCPEFICKKCGKARVKIYEYKGGTIGKSWHDHSKDLEEGMLQSLGGLDKQGDEPYQRVDRGYSDCGCNAGFEGGIVLDPFMGAGTSALVALKQRKRFIGIEIKQEYIDMSYKRIAKVQQRIF